jgi:cyclohexyl-isocyanide hydratase
VKDGNVITGGGVTSGIDFGLRVVAEIAGPRQSRKLSSCVSNTIPNPPLHPGIPTELRRR